MRQRTQSDPFGHGTNSDYFSRRAERLVLEGYRHWAAGFQTGSITPWEMGWSLYVDMLGYEHGEKLTTEMQGFVRTLKLCSACPLRAFPFNSRHLCLEECLVLGLVAGLQSDDEVAEFCLNRLTCPARCDPIRRAAQRLADTLSAMDAQLLPVPRHVIDDIVQRASEQKAALANAGPSTLH